MSSLDGILWQVHQFATWKLGPLAGWLQEQGIALANLLRTSHHHAWQDLKTRWRRGLPWILLPGILIGLIICLRFSISAPISEYLDYRACLPDGDFSFESRSYNYWAIKGFFQVTLGFGTLSFAEAKIIDVAWDIIIGRGGQAILVLLSWNVFAAYVTATMQIAPVTFKTFRTLFIQKDISTLLGIMRLTRGFLRRPHKLPSKTAMVFMTATMAFILAFPTFGSAMTGYSANVAAFIEDRSSNFVALNNFRFLYYTIEDGEKINKTQGYQITSASYRSYFDMYSTSSTCDWSNSTGLKDECNFMDDVTDYILRYGIEGATNNTTTFGIADPKPVAAPSLNIKVHYMPYRYLWPLKYYLNLPETKELAEPKYSSLFVRTPSGGQLNLTAQDRVMWTNGVGSSYNEAYMKGNGICQPTLTYQWGFSYIQLILMILFLIFWSIGLYILHISAHVTMLRNGHVSHAPGDYQADVRLVRAIETQTGETSEMVEEKEVVGMSAEELKRCIEKDLNGGSMSNKESLLKASDAGDEVPTWRLGRWMKKEALWLLMLAVSVFGCLMAVWQRPSFVLAHFAPLLLIFTMYVGQSWGSRLVLLVWSVLVILIVSLPVWNHTQPLTR